MVLLSSSVYHHVFRAYKSFIVFKHFFWHSLLLSSESYIIQWGLLFRGNPLVESTFKYVFILPWVNNKGSDWNYCIKLMVFDALMVFALDCMVAGSRVNHDDEDWTDVSISGESKTCVISRTKITKHMFYQSTQLYFLDPFCWLFPKYFILWVAKQYLSVACKILPTESNDTFDEPWQSFCSANTKHVTWIVKRPRAIPNKSRVIGVFQKM